MTRRRRTVAVACIALVLVAAVLPLGGVAFDWVIAPTAFVLLEPRPPVTSIVDVRQGTEQPVAYPGTLDSRGPPSPSFS